MRNMQEDDRRTMRERAIALAASKTIAAIADGTGMSESWVSRVVREAKSEGKLPKPDGAKIQTNRRGPAMHRASEGLRERIPRVPKKILDRDAIMPAARLFAARRIGRKEFLRRISIGTITQ